MLSEVQAIARHPENTKRNSLTVEGKNEQRDKSHVCLTH